MARQKILPKRTVFCCLAFDEKSIMLLGYAVALALITSVFVWQASMQLWVPLSLGQNKPATQGSCIISNADLVCHDRFESDCQSLINVTVLPEFAINGTVGVTLLNYWYPTFSLTKPVAEYNTDYFRRASRINCWYWGDPSTPNNILYFQGSPTFVGVSQWITGILMSVLGLCVFAGFLYCFVTAMSAGWGAGSCRPSKQGYFYVEMNEFGVNNYSATPYDTSDPEAQPINAEAAVIDRPERVLFMRKVFATLVLQFAITFGMVAVTICVPGVRHWVALTAPFWLIYVAMGGGLVLMFALFVLAEKTPINLIIVSLFSVAFGAMISFVAVRYSVAVVFHASVLVMVVLFCTSAFTLTARGAYPYFWAMLGAFVGITISCIFLGIYLPFPNAAQAIGAITGALLWTLFLLWDMAVIANYYSEDMWVLGAVTIYLDTLNILLFLLRFLGGRSRQ